MKEAAREDATEREQLRIVFAAMFMHAEISAARDLVDDNSDLAARALRRADMLLKLQRSPSP